jgi:hypothetical protein
MKHFSPFAALLVILATSHPAGAQTTMISAVDGKQRQAIVFRRLQQSLMAGGYECLI